MYERGQIWMWGTRLVFLDDVSHYKINEKEHITARVREIKEGNEVDLTTTTIDLTHEKENLSFIGEMEDDDYIQFITATWHKRVPDTWNYQVCSMKEATHVIFTEMDLALAGEDGKAFTPSKIYPIQKEKESGDFYIVDDNKDIIIGFDLFIPCEYLKEKSAELDEQNHRVLKELPKNVISMSDYLRRKRR